jgi:uncharacterized protein (DUF1684 family)
MLSGCTGLLLAVWITACSVPVDPAYVREVDAWHAERVARLTTDTGWLTLVGLHHLHAGEQTIGSGADADVQLPAKAPPLIGTLTVGAGEPVFQAAPGARVTLWGAPEARPIQRQLLHTDAAEEATVLAVGSLLCHIIDRGGELYLRVRDRESDLLRTFTGIERFPVRPEWRVIARLVPSDSAGSVAVPNVLGQISESPCPGTLHFTLAGTACRLRPIGEPLGGLFIVFGDATNGHTTYGGGRFLGTDPIGDDGTVILDFNRATNPPCAFTPFATCPLPPQGNVLAVTVTAGEKRWGPAH